MATVAVTPGSGANVDTALQADGTTHRQIAVVGDGTAANTATVNAAGELFVHGDGGSSATRTSYTHSTVEAQVLAANTSRHDLSVYNFGTSNLYVGLGTTVVTSTNATVMLPPGTLYEAPTAYRGVVRALASATGGNSIFTETIA